MEKNSKILFLGRKKCQYGKKMINELKKSSVNVQYFLSNNINGKVPKAILKWKGDYIFSFRSYFIVPNKLLKQVTIACINFHPGPPKYRGIGCVNFTIFNSEKYYGSTAHIMTDKVDQGKIIDVKRFKITAKDNISSLLQKTYKFQFFQFKRILKNLKKNKKFGLALMLKKSKKEKWSKILYTRKMLNKFYTINFDVDKKMANIEKYFRSTLTSNYIPYVDLNYEKK